MGRPFKRMSTSKFGAVRTNGYDSKREAEYAAELAMRKAALNGDVADWLEQVPIKLSGSTYRVDFMVIQRDGSVQFVEVKGVELPAWKAKMRELAATRPEVFGRLIVVK